MKTTKAESPGQEAPEVMKAEGQIQSHFLNGNASF